jgi:lipoate-protein ligase A
MFHDFNNEFLIQFFCFFRFVLKDYAFGDRKFGGNAQSITKNRWIHHTSFLWDYEVKNMSYLKLPAKAPKYRLVSLY